MKKAREFNGANSAAKQSATRASRQDAYAADYAGLKGFSHWEDWCGEFRSDW